MCREDGQTAHAVLMMGDDQYCLKWNYHWTNLVGVFNSLLQTETFVDVTLSCEGQRLKAHRLLLSACSPYFTRLLVDNPDRHPVIILKGVKFAHLKTIIHFIYNGEVAVEQRELPALVSVARELQIRGLADNRLQEAQLQLAATQSLAKAAGADGEGGGRAAEGSNGAGLPGAPLGGAFAVTLGNSSNGSSFNTSNGSRMEEGDSASFREGAVVSSPHIISLPLSLVTSASSSSVSDQPTDLTSSSSKQRHRSRTPPVTPTPTSDKPPPPTPPPPLTHTSVEDVHPERRSSPRPDGLGSPTRKRRRLSGSDGEVTTPETKGYGALRLTCNSGYLATNGLAENVEERRPLSGPSNDALHNENEPLALTVDSSRGDCRPPLLPSPLSGGTPPSKPPPPHRDKDGDKPPQSNAPQHDAFMKEESDYTHYNPSCSPSPRPLSATSLPHTSPLLPSAGPPPLSRHQLAFIQRALSVGYPPLPYLPPGLDPQQGTQPPVHSPVSGINSQTKDLLQFLDLFKSLNSGDPALVSGLAPAFPIPGVVGSPPGGPISPSKEGDPEYTCHICARIMPSKHFLEEHIKIHEEEKPYKCDHCGQRYKYQSAFQRHQEQNHTAKLPGEKPYRCTVCGQCFKYHKSFLKHRSNHDVLDHIMKNEADDSKPSLPPSYIQCLLNSRLSSHCQHPLPSAQAHPASMHHQELREAQAAPMFKEEMVDIDDSSTNADQQPATTSSSSFAENGEIKEEDEDADESDIGKFMHCLKCKATFRDVISFDAHCKVSANDCTQEFMREVSVQGDNSNLSNPHSGSSSPPASPHRSPGWPASLNSRSPLAGAAASSPQLQGAMLSPSCATTATSSFYSHLTNINFTSMTGGPKGGIAMGGSPIIVSAAASVCPASVCAPTLGGTTGPGTSKLEDLAGPGGGVMEEERPFKCPYCTKGFKGRENLKLHIRTHTGEKPYNCGVCGKAFGGRSDMNRHLRIHTGEKPYPCKVCGKKFARADYLSKHITTHLGIPFAKPVHSLQQSLQNLETIQNYHNIQNLHKVNNVQSN